ncbi:MAG: hydrogenase iron-sulfur subunit [Anaerolineae bacterium]|jgi:F420-non-reducing hydrogenase iron-sulfur subunit
MARTEPRVVVLTCNWNALQSLDQAGKQRFALPPGVRPLKVTCMGQVGSSAILKAFEKGADGVMLVACAPEECHYEFGSRRAAEMFKEVRQLTALLGIHGDRLQFTQVGTGEGANLVGRLQDFVDRLASLAEEPIHRQQPSAIGEGAAD